MIAGVAAAAVGVMLWGAIRPEVGLFFNGTVSLPLGFYHLRDTPVQVGDVVVACLGKEASALALARAYVSEGDCSYGTAPVGKILAATEGDTVAVTKDGVWLAGRLLPNSTPLGTDSDGYSLPDGRGRYVLNAGEAWLYSGYHARSFDSRYYGPVPMRDIRGRAVPLWVWPGPYDARRDLYGHPPK